ncbi:GH1 family beta-glucosidase [Paremcibacter congregatus]|uniref:Beta-glucosidase n=1 Tax=Paremcibacter congregatus TaxID=2043170 RepID=A0A2G4YW15_9PROT|nr:GH1 family beta-glucosidase [Paremcibacter congregatus]PHZ86515.1 beta-glucosidase [Paremcibacter congregatus]QDE26318.1 beta-glucosidase [Paremcibacter congregatus]
MSSPLTFPEKFLWGSATAAYQIEGSPSADGAGPSIWQRFSHTPNNILNGDTGDIACDHYNRTDADVALMKQLSMQAYRFSIAWGRILPEGFGAVNKPGLDHYDRLVDRLLESNITPMATLYHWDLPQSLGDRGGWLNPDNAKWFGDYAELVFNRLDDRVKLWATLNEPWVVMDNGYMHGLHAPGHRSHHEAAIVSHNLLRASAEAVRRYRTVGKNKIGLVVNLEPKYPASQDPQDVAAAQRADAYMNRQYLDPVLLGKYPPEMQDIFGDAWPAYTPQELNDLREPLDFIGVNYYSRGVTRHAEGEWPLHAKTVRQPQSTYTETGWEVCPQAFTDVLNWVKDRYNNPPVYITENGSAFYDPPVAENDRIEDPLRQGYLKTHLRAIHQAIQEGCDIRGYFAWSLMDNLEWAYGFSKRFGLVHVNYENQKRTPKESAKLYKRIIESNGRCLF